MKSNHLPLNAYPVMRTSNVDDIIKAIGPTLGAQFRQLPRSRKKLDALANCRGLSASKFWFCSYGAPIKLGFPEVDYFRLQIWHKGFGATSVRGMQIPVTPNRGCITSTPMEIQYGPDFQQLAVRIDTDALVRKLVALTGIHISKRLECDPALDLTTPESRHLLRTLNFLVQHFDQPEAEIPPLLLAELEQAFMVAFLCASRHNYSHLLDRQPPDIAPWSVRRAEEFIEANWNRSITVEEIAAAIGASARSIFRTFKQSRGYSPMAFLKQVRLRHAQNLLKCADPGATVTAVAFACGFGELGRFSRDYRRAFGELPSAALGRARHAGRSGI